MTDSGPLEIRFRVNGVGTRVVAPPAARAIDVLRGSLALTGVKDGCGVGECGACTILVDDTPTLSCLLVAAELGERDLTTIETTTDDRVVAMREAFLAEGAVQCGFCTPGMVLAASRVPTGASEDEIRGALVGNLCRCTGYSSIVRAVRRSHERG